MDRSGNFKFILRVFPCGSLIVWGLPGNYDLSRTPSVEELAKLIQSRRILRYYFSEWKSGASDFFNRLRKDVLQWFEDPWVFMSTDEVFRGFEQGGEKVMVIPETSAPREIRFIETIESLAGAPHLPQSPRLAREKLLLHVCCGPDAAGVVKQLKEDFDLECFWYDPNIQPREEHDKRLEAFEKVMRIYDVPYVVGPYDVDHFERAIEGLEWTPEQGAKCSVCYDLRLEKSAQLAREKGFPSYATTLAISPHKVQMKLQKFGELNFKKWGVRYYHKAFLKKDGFNDSVEFTREHDIYRQDYCGCFYSLHEGGAAAQKMAHELGYLPPLGKT